MQNSLHSLGRGCDISVGPGRYRGRSLSLPRRWGLQRYFGALSLLCCWVRCSGSSTWSWCWVWRSAPASCTWSRCFWCSCSCLLYFFQVSVVGLAFCSCLFCLVLTAAVEGLEACSSSCLSWVWEVSSAHLPPLIPWWLVYWLSQGRAVYWLPQGRAMFLGCSLCCSRRFFLFGTTTRKNHSWPCMGPA